MNIVDELTKQIEALQKQIKAIQEACSHPKAAVTEKPGANTGNYDPSADMYWVDYHCGLCQKHWTITK